MNNKRLVEIIKDPGIATEKEIKQINTYSEEYSYSPFLKVLQTRLDHLHDVKNKAKSLTKAAIYIADRSILKDFITNDKLSIVTSEVSPAQARTKKDKKSDKSATVTDIKEKSGDKGIVDTDDPVVLKDKAKVVVDGKQAEVLSEEVLAESRRKKEKDEDVVADINSGEKQEGESSGKPEEKPDELPSEKSREKQEIVEEPEVKEETGLIQDTIEELEVKEDTELKQEAVKDPEDKQEVSKEEMEPLDEIDKSIQASEGKETSSSLSKEIMDNISELKKHKASLLNLLNIDTSDDSSPSDSEPEKSSKKEKSKKKEAHKDKKKELIDKSSKPEKIESETAPSIDSPENENYPDYEEEDPVVIKDFLTRLEESNPPPKKKLKKEEQEKLIEKFIQSDPQMQNVRSSKELTEKKDLSAPSVKFRDDIISENLASIMIKQGKHETAIDIYKKLIWKFPQKKAYFATQIEELKKKLKK